MFEHVVNRFDMDFSTECGFEMVFMKIQKEVILFFIESISSLYSCRDEEIS